MLKHIFFSAVCCNMRCGVRIDSHTGKQELAIFFGEEILQGVPVSIQGCHIRTPQRRKTVQIELSDMLHLQIELSDMLHLQIFALPQLQIGHPVCMCVWGIIMFHTAIVLCFIDGYHICIYKRVDAWRVSTLLI